MRNQIIQGDCLEVLKTLSDKSVDCCITSPPYWGLRDYGVEGQLGLEKTSEEYVQNLVAVFREVRRVLKKEGTLWLNLGDSYAAASSPGFQGKNGQRANRRFTASKTIVKMGGGLKAKDLVGIPWMVAFGLRADGWYLRQDIIWAKNSVMPESVTDRCTKSHEHVFLLAKNQKYYFNNEAIKEEAVWDIDGNGTIKRKERAKEGLKSFPDGKRAGIRFTYPDGKHGEGQQSAKTISGFRNKRDVWTVNPKPFKEAHFATFPEDLIVPMVKAGCPEGGLVLDPFMGAGTTGLVAKKLQRDYLGIELNPEYIDIAQKRIHEVEKQPTIL